MLDFNNQLILLGKTKNGRQQLIPMSNQLSAILQEYLLYRLGEPDDYLFCSVHGTQLTRDGAATVLSRYHKRREVEKTSAHVYRHTFAKYWILNGGDPFTLKDILGHSTMEMVNQYVNIYGKDLEKVFNAYNPLDNFLRETKGEHIKMRR